MRALTPARLLIVVSLAGLLVFGGACGGDDEDGDATPVATAAASNDDAKAIEKVVRDNASAWDAKDFAAFSALHTEKGLKEELADAEDPNTPEGLKAGFDLFVADDRLVIDSIDAIEVDGNDATAVVEAYTEPREAPSSVSILLGVDVAFVKDGEAWKIDGLAFTSPAAPDGVTTVHIDANEFAFAFIAEDVTSGNVAFEIANVGKQPHHVTIEKVPADFDIEAALQSEEDPEGLTHIGSTPPWEPGVTQYVVFTGPLEAGDYVMLCFMPDTDDPEGTPHALKGMYKEFSVD